MWEYNTTNCKHQKPCDYAPRCQAKSKKECKYYEEDKRNFYQKVYEDGLWHTIIDTYRKEY